jgi:glycosyltransferase involved in cell wall biosynthesis
MRVLVVLTQPPLPEGGAPGKTAIGLLRGLVAHGVDVRAVAARQHFALAGEVPADLPVEIVRVEPPGRWRARLGRFHRPRGELAGGAFAARVRELAADADVVHLEETETAWSDEGLATPSLVHLHYLVRRDRPLGRPWERQFRDVVEIAAGERAAIRRHRHLVASSPLVADALRRKAPKAEVVVAPLSLDPLLYPPAPLDGPPTAGIIGTAGWPTTAAAIHELVDRVWPLVRVRAPEARLLVAGRGTDRLGIIAGDGVTVLGEVESAPELLRQLSVLLFPLRRGSGMKVKVLEAIASGVPVVTTPSGAEGIEGGAGVAVHTGADALAAATAELLVDAALRRARGAAARAAFVERYTPEPATAPLVELYRRMAGDRR